MKVVICWSHISGYMAACWRTLAATPGVNAFVFAFEPDDSNPFAAGLLDGVPHRLLSSAERQNASLVCRLVAEQSPDVLMVGAWNHASYRALVADASVARATKVLGIDTPLRYDWRQAFGRWVRRPYLRRFAAVAVPGERAASYARYLGFAESQIRRGLYGIDADAFAGCLAKRLVAGPWPRRFLYVGRYVPEKAIDVLAEAYARYRAATDDPWELVCCGRGAEGYRLRGLGVTDLGFVAPADQPNVFASAGAMVMASRYEPWGVAVAEAAAAGLPLVCSTACGAAVELLRDGFNGYTFATDDVSALARRLRQISARPDLAEWGDRSHAMSLAYRAELWPHRVFDGLLPV